MGVLVIGINGTKWGRGKDVERRMGDIKVGVLVIGKARMWHRERGTLRWVL